MFAKLFLLFVLVPLIELGLLLLMSAYAGGPFLTWGLVIASGLLGAWLAKQQGVKTFRRIQEELAAGQMPTDSMLDGMLILLAGTLLLTPGLLTDFVGLTILIPPLRFLYRRRITTWFKKRFKIKSFYGGEVVAESGAAEPGVVDSFVVNDSEKITDEEEK